MRAGAMSARRRDSYADGFATPTFLRTYTQTLTSLR